MTDYNEFQGMSPVSILNEENMSLHEGLSILRNKKEDFEKTQSSMMSESPSIPDESEYEFRSEVSYSPCSNLEDSIESSSKI